MVSNRKPHFYIRAIDFTIFSKHTNFIHKIVENEQKNRHSEKYILALNNATTRKNKRQPFFAFMI